MLNLLDFFKIWASRNLRLLSSIWKFDVDLYNDLNAVVTQQCMSNIGNQWGTRLQ